MDSAEGSGSDAVTSVQLGQVVCFQSGQWCIDRLVNAPASSRRRVCPGVQVCRCVLCGALISNSP